MPTKSESDRLLALDSYDVLDSAPEEAFDRLTALAADLFDVPIALVSLVDAERQWFKSRQGLDAESTPRDWAFCAHAIEQDSDTTMVVEDATRDARFQGNPLVTGDPNIRFYAGAVLTGTDGHNLGTLCVIDTKTRPAPSDADLRRLRTLARIVVDELELRRTTRLGDEKRRLLDMAEQMSGVGRWRYQVSTGKITWSDEVYRIHGVSRDDYDPDYDGAVGFYHPDDQAEISELLGRAVETGRDFDCELRIKRPDGEQRDVACRATTAYGASGVVDTVYGVFQDITRQKQMVRNLEAGRDRAEELARRASFAEQVAGLGHWRLDVATRAISWSDQMYHIYGLEPGSNVEVDTLQSLYHPDDAQVNAARIAQIEAGATSSDIVTRILRRDESVRWLRYNSRPERGPDGEVVAMVGTVHDITDQRAAENAIAESERRFRSLAVHAPDMITEMGLDGVMTYVSPASQAILGFTPEEMLGRTPFSFMHPDDAARVMEMCRQVLVSKGAVEPWSVEYRAYDKAGRERWMESKPTFVADPASGRFIGLTDAMRDITRRKDLEAELRQARAEAEAATAVKTEFLANMSHELRTPLTSIIGFTRLAAEQSELAPLTRNYVERVGDASRALLCTVNDILDFSKLEAGQVSIQPEPVSLAQLTRATLELFTPQAGAKDLTLTLDDEAEARVLRLDPDRMRQVLLNLVSNAVKFTAAGGVTLRTRYDSLSGQLTVEVLDTGDGIPPEKQGRLFKRFSQVDGGIARTHGGTGLGLAICKGLVEAMGGEIGADSVPGQGSRFWFRIPAPLSEIAGAAKAVRSSEPAAFAGIRVLVVDDHPANRELAKLYLAGLGAEVTEAASGEEAVKAAAEQPFDVILMDLRMPGLDGHGALRQIRSKQGPNDSTPILAFTADADTEIAGKLETQGFQDVVAKPMDPVQLIAAVGRAATYMYAPEGLADAR